MDTIIGSHRGLVRDSNVIIRLQMQCVISNNTSNTHCRVSSRSSARFSATFGRDVAVIMCGVVYPNNGFTRITYLFSIYINARFLVDISRACAVHLIIVTLVITTH